MRYPTNSTFSLRGLLVLVLVFASACFLVIKIRDSVAGHRLESHPAWRMEGNNIKFLETIEGNNVSDQLCTFRLNCLGKTSASFQLSLRQAGSEPFLLNLTSLPNDRGVISTCDIFIMPTRIEIIDEGTKIPEVIKLQDTIIGHTSVNYYPNSITSFSDGVSVPVCYCPEMSRCEIRVKAVSSK